MAGKPQSGYGKAAIFIVLPKLKIGANEFARIQLSFIC